MDEELLKIKFSLKVRIYNGCLLLMNCDKVHLYSGAFKYTIPCAKPVLGSQSKEYLIISESSSNQANFPLKWLDTLKKIS